jgi:spore maturation protein A
MVNVIWLFLISLGIGFSLVTGKMDIINAEVISSANNGIEMVFRMMPLLILWMGIMQIALKSGLLDLFAIVISPLLAAILLAI